MGQTTLGRGASSPGAWLLYAATRTTGGDSQTSRRCPPAGGAHCQRPRHTASHCPGVKPPHRSHLLGFTFRGKKIRWSGQALEDFKHRIRRLTKRSWGISMQRRLRELRLYIQGWINYFGLSEYYRPLPGLDEWIRRRLRMCYLKQWCRPRTRIRNLIKLGTRTLTTVSLGLSSKGTYRLAKTLATHSGMTNKWLAEQGLVSVRELWIKFYYA